ncbi:divergent polysaccharide deacetylase family protein [Candidatus Odyssella thessalonicensis]|uniref:divergent polysaccharide deacetylase family protein n=1 Tax=Candidatus Odyssella thessalonicensis TaxID=84647 RepID=UPI000225ABC1|nr:divergent polysaccharide deacetylase family protein [Candidatus Odyssella thessalonicensis]
MKFPKSFKFLDQVKHILQDTLHTFKLLAHVIQKARIKKNGVMGKIVPRSSPAKADPVEKLLHSKGIKGISGIRIWAAVFLLLALIGVTSALLWQKLTKVVSHYTSDHLDKGSHKGTSSQASEQASEEAGPDAAHELSAANEKSVQAPERKYSYPRFLPEPTGPLPPAKSALSHPKEDKVAASNPSLSREEKEEAAHKIKGHASANHHEDRAHSKGEERSRLNFAVNRKQPYVNLSNTIVDTINPQFLIENPITSQQEVAIIVRGFGISPEKSDRITDQLPPNVTLAVSPYTPNIKSFVETLKIQGFDVLLSLFMEGYSQDSDSGRLTLRLKASQQQREEILNQYLSLSTGCSGFYAEGGQRFLKSHPEVLECLSYLSEKQKVIIAPPDVLMNQFHIAAVQARANYAGVSLVNPNTNYASELVSLVKRTGYGIIVFDMDSEDIIDKINQWIKILSDNKIDIVPISFLLREPKDVTKSDK